MSARALRGATPGTRAKRPDSVRQRIRIAEDSGGTFTDGLAVLEPGGRIWVAKTLTTPRDPGEAVSTVIGDLLRQIGAMAAGTPAVTEVVHGTTLVTNTLIERKGAATGLVVTRGTRDVLSIAREIRYELYDLNLEIPVPRVAVVRRLDRPRERPRAPECRTGERRSGPRTGLLCPRRARGDGDRRRSRSGLLERGQFPGRRDEAAQGSRGCRTTQARGPPALLHERRGLGRVQHRQREHGLRRAHPYRREGSRPARFRNGCDGRRRPGARRGGRAHASI